MHHVCLSLAKCRLCGYENQTRVAPWSIHVLLYDWPLVLATYLVYVSPFDWLGLFTTQVHALLFHWFTCLLLFGLCIDHCLVHVSPFDWYLCQLICQIIILNFVLTPLSSSFEEVKLIQTNHSKSDRNFWFW